MAEEKILEIGGDSGEEIEKSKVDNDLDRSRGDSDELSGSLSEGDDNGQRRGSDNEQKQRKGRRQRRLKGGKRHHRRHHPYVGTSYGDRAAAKTMAMEYPHAPRNTTQYLIEDHVKNNISPDLSNRATPESNCEDTTDAYEMPTVQNLEEVREEVRGRPQDSPLINVPFTASERSEYDQEFVAVYDHVNEDRLYSMSKEELIRMTSRLLEKVEGGRRAADHERNTDRVRDSPNTTPLSSCN